MTGVEELVERWPWAGAVEQYRLREQAQAVDCPLPGCLADAGQPCSYLGPSIDPETGRTVAMVRILRPAHLERLAVLTGGRLYGYTLRSLERKP